MESQNATVGRISACRCCGTCCVRGGPAFHGEDRPLIEKGIIPIRYLYTIRKGELVNDPIRGALLPVNSEVIKIKGKTDSRICTFFDERTLRCRIYAERPLECRLLKCWDTAAIESMYERDRLSRRDLLAGVAGLWDLLVEHERRCSYDGLAKRVARLKQSPHKSRVGDFGEIVAYDRQVRQLAVERGLLEPEKLDFLFGRPLDQTMVMFDLRVRRG